MDHPRIDWLSGTPSESIAEYLLWRGAIEVADQRGDTSSLIELFRSSHYPGPEARNLIADLLARRVLGKKQGRQATPSYQTTPAEARWVQAWRAYLYFRKHRKPHDIALVLALQTDINGETDEELDIPEKDVEALHAFVKGRRGSTQRMRRRRNIRP